MFDMDGTGYAPLQPPVPPEIMDALEAHDELRQALQESGLPTRFSAMVLGLAALRQLGEERERQGATTAATVRKNSMGWGVLS